MVPVPPRKSRQPVGEVFRKTPPDGSGRIAGNDGVGGNVLGDDGAGRDHGASANAATRQHDCAMTDPDIVADMHALAFPPVEELGFVRLPWKIGAGAIGEM